MPTLVSTLEMPSIREVAEKEATIPTAEAGPLLSTQRHDRGWLPSVLI